jgi:hypothetical protein
MSRGELAAVAIGMTLLAVGSLSIGAATLRLHRSSMTLVTFGLWCAMYGARLLSGRSAVRTTLGGTLPEWQMFGATITYTINLPITDENDVPRSGVTPTP